VLVVKGWGTFRAAFHTAFLVGHDFPTEGTTEKPIVRWVATNNVQMTKLVMKWIPNMIQTIRYCSFMLRMRISL
jgi:hypothetical protein